MKHYDFGSSTAARTDACQAWRVQSENIPRKESQYAKDGTIIHSMLEMRALDDDYDFNRQIGQTVEGGTVTEDHVEKAIEFWAVTEEVLARHGAVEWEPEVTGTAAADVGGTLDLVAACGDKTLLIDYKTGMGVQVSPVNNKQILFAAAVCGIDSAAADMIQASDNYVGIIIQPDSAGNVAVKEWEFTREQVDQWWPQHKENIGFTRLADYNTEPVAGDHCKFCPANGLCDATNGNLLRIQQLDLQDQAALVEALNMLESVKDTIRAVEKLAYEQLEVGVQLPGWKLVNKRATRKWRDEEAALKYLRRPLGGKKAVVTEKLISPAQAEKLAKKQGVNIDISPLVTAESSGFTLAPETDKRDAAMTAEVFKHSLAGIA